MSDEQQWRQTCEECGTELVAVQVAFEEADFSEGLTGIPVVRDVCPNPACRRHDADLTALAGDEPAQGAQDDQADQDDQAGLGGGGGDERPGSLGGDNGGA